MVNVDKIKSLAEKKGIKISFLCDRLGLTRGYFNDVKRGKNKISSERIAKIADYLDCSIDYLMGRTDLLYMVFIKKKSTAKDNDSL